MKSFRILATVLSIALGAGLALPSTARDDRLKFLVEEAMQQAEAGRLDGSVKFYWGEQAYPDGAQLMGSYTANKKTNFFNKSDKEGCEWAWLSAMLSLQDRARSEGGNAVVNIHSVYRNGEFKSETEYECGAGAVMGGVALRGTVAKLP
ncbi:MAG: excinuclease ATPase subunit [Panacagrimonas sp.]